MRDDKWLFQKLDEVWDNHFPDIPQDNDVHIVWGRKARTRLGSIKLQRIPNTRFQIQNSKSHPASIITINGLFTDPNIPEYVVVGTIAHELAHYAHGFNSPLAQKYQNPHAGGVIHHEMRQRGLHEIEKQQKKWLKENWAKYLQEKMPRKIRARKRIIWV